MVSTKGRTTIPTEIRAALHINPGDRLEYAIQGDHAVIRVYRGLGALKGALPSERGKGMSIAQIRAALANAARRSVD